MGKSGHRLRFNEVSQKRSRPPGSPIREAAGQSETERFCYPTMLSIWHVYGEQADAPMNRLLTEQQRNLEFAADTGYMPVSSAAFDAIADYPFEQRSYQRLYDVYNEMRLQNTPPVRAGHRGVPRQGKGLVRQPAPAPEGLPPAPCQRRNAGSPDRGDLAAAV